MRVLFITNIPSPYRVDFFNELGKHCKLDVIFEKENSTERDKSWQNRKILYFNSIFLKGIPFKKDMAICLNVIKYLHKNKYDKIVVCNMASPTGIIAIHYFIMKKIPYYIEGDGAFPIKLNGIKYMLKKYLIKHAAGCFSTSELHDEYYLMNGASKEKIFRYPFSSILKKDIIDKPYSDKRKKTIRNKLNIIEDKVIISVGQFIPRKGYDILLKAIRNFDTSVGVYIIGGKPTQEYINIISEFNNINQIHFIEFSSKEKIFDYFSSSDIFVLPTREDIWGLVINEAMANALPIITTNRCIAGTELIKNNYNGYVIEVDDYVSLKNKLQILINDELLCNSMANNTLSIIEKYTIENMVKTHLDIFESL